MGATPKSRRERWNELDKKKEINCGQCPPHKGENKQRNPAKSDRYKSKRKGR